NILALHLDQPRHGVLQLEDTLARSIDLLGRRTPSEVKFAADSAAEGSGFELSVPLRRATTSELSVPPAVNAVGARLPRKRQVYPLSGWRRVLRSCCPHLAPCAAWSRSAPAIEFKGAP